MGMLPDAESIKKLQTDVAKEVCWYNFLYVFLLQGCFCKPSGVRSVREFEEYEGQM